MPCSSIKTEERNRLSLGSFDKQVAQLQSNTGLPVEVPVPRKVSFMNINVLNKYNFRMQGDAELEFHIFDDVLAKIQDVGSHRISWID